MADRSRGASRQSMRSVRHPRAAAADDGGRAGQGRASAWDSAARFQISGRVTPSISATEQPPWTEEAEAEIESVLARAAAERSGARQL